MVFSTPLFLFAYLPVVLLLYYLAPLKWRNFVLLLASLFFYFWGERIYTVIMLASFGVVRQIYLAVTKALGAGFIAVALAYPVGWILCSTLLVIRYSRSVLVRGEKAVSGQ